jgi:hypothetical protein
VISQCSNLKHNMWRKFCVRFSFHTYLMRVTTTPSSFMLYSDNILWEIKIMKTLYHFMYLPAVAKPYFHAQIRQKIVYEGQIRWNVHMCIIPDICHFTNVKYTVYLLVQLHVRYFIQGHFTLFLGYSTNCSYCLCRQYVIEGFLFVVFYLATLAA